MPYKSLSDTKPTTPTGHVVGTQKMVQKEIVQKGPACRNTDYGNFASAVGKVYGIDDTGAEYEMVDTCFGNMLYEYNCDGNKPVVEQAKCKNGCQNGYCI